MGHGIKQGRMDGRIPPPKQMQVGGGVTYMQCNNSRCSFFFFGGGGGRLQQSSWIRAPTSCVANALSCCNTSICLRMCSFPLLVLKKSLSQLNILSFFPGVLTKWKKMGLCFLEGTLFSLVPRVAKPWTCCSISPCDCRLKQGHMLWIQWHQTRPSKRLRKVLYLCGWHAISSSFAIRDCSCGYPNTSATYNGREMWKLFNGRCGLTNAEGGEGTQCLSAGPSGWSPQFDGPIMMARCISIGAVYGSPVSRSSIERLLSDVTVHYPEVTGHKSNSSHCQHLPIKCRTSWPDKGSEHWPRANRWSDHGAALAWPKHRVWCSELWDRRLADGSWLETTSWRGMWHCNEMHTHCWPLVRRASWWRRKDEVCPISPREPGGSISCVWRRNQRLNGNLRTRPPLFERCYHRRHSGKQNECNVHGIDWEVRDGWPLIVWRQQYWHLICLLNIHAMEMNPVVLHHWECSAGEKNRVEVSLACGANHPGIFAFNGRNLLSSKQNLPVWRIFGVHCFCGSTRFGLNDYPRGVQQGDTGAYVRFGGFGLCPNHC